MSFPIIFRNDIGNCEVMIMLFDPQNERIPLIFHLLFVTWDIIYKSVDIEK